MAELVVMLAMTAVDWLVNFSKRVQRWLMRTLVGRE